MATKKRSPGFTVTEGPAEIKETDIKIACSGKEFLVSIPLEGRRWSLDSGMLMPTVWILPYTFQNEGGGSS